jgi:hypothetical protein
MDLNTAVQRLFAPADQPGRIGVEAELIAVTDTPRPQPVDPADLTPGFDTEFVRAAVPTFEPGGQLELSPPPRASVATPVRDLVRLIGRAGGIAAARGVRLEAVGTNPYHSCAQVPLRISTREAAGAVPPPHSGFGHRRKLLTSGAGQVVTAANRPTSRCGRRRPLGRWCCRPTEWPPGSGRPPHRQRRRRRVARG